MKESLLWTCAALECYKRGCRCKGCFYDAFFQRSKREYNRYYNVDLGNKRFCQMKESVLNLVKYLGVPTPEQQRELLKKGKI